MQRYAGSESTTKREAAVRQKLGAVLLSREQGAEHVAERYVSARSVAGGGTTETRRGRTQLGVMSMSRAPASLRAGRRCVRR